MGGSGLIVVVIVAAWALFLVPQWMHRRASAAAHLADRIEPIDGEAVSGSVRLGRRQLRRTRPADTAPAGRSAGWHLPSLPSVLRRSRREPVTAVSPSTPVSAAARRRRVVTTLALTTLLTAVVVGVGGLADLPVPTWLVAVPGGLMVAYLVLLAVVRPGAPRRGVAETVRVRPTRDVDLDAAGAGAVATVDEPAVVVTDQQAPVRDQVETPVETDLETDLETDVERSTWTPVPLPTPTYVTAPRARRSVRTIDLSNPGSWTSSSAAVQAAATPAPRASDEREDYLVEHRRAVGD